MWSRAVIFFFFNDTATTEIYTLSLHDALPICEHGSLRGRSSFVAADGGAVVGSERWRRGARLRHRHGRLRSEEHTSELQSQSNLVCRLLLEKKKKKQPSAARCMTRLSGARAST